MLVSSLYIIIGLVLLMGGAEYTVKGSVAIAKKLNIPSMIIGLTIVAFGTSAPEFVVSINAALKGSSGISIGNVVGSNIANILLILGVSSLIYPMKTNPKSFLHDWIFMFIVTLLFIIFALNGYFAFYEGITFLIILFCFLIFNYYNSKHDEKEKTSSPEAKKNWTLISLMTIAGIAAIIFGADCLIKGAVEIARILNVSEEFIGLTVIAFGTSLPELAVSGMAAFRRKNGIALGNIIGSNIWNILFILGSTSIITEIPVPQNFMKYDVWVMLVATIILLPMMYTRKRLSRREGALLVFCYCIYIYSQFLINSGTWVF